MSGFPHNCPFCGTQNSAFEMVAQYQSKARSHSWFVLAECGTCGEVGRAELTDQEFVRGRSSKIDPSAYARENVLSSRFKVDNFAPRPKSTRIASGLPENVRLVAEEAEKSFQFGLYGAASACYRKAIERAVKILNPDGGGTLNARIREIEKKGLLPTAMIELLDEVRIFGNASMHDEDYNPGKSDCMAAREFVHLFLTYGFSLPAMIEAAKSKTGEQNAYSTNSLTLAHAAHTPCPHKE